MQVTLSRISPVEVELKVQLPKERVLGALQKAYATLGRDAQIRGFRKGKAPLGVLKTYFGDRVAAEVSGQLIEETLSKAIADQKLSPVVDPKVNLVEGGVKEGSEFAYQAKLEVRPEVGEIVLEGISLTRELSSVAEAQIDEEIDRLRDRYATLRTPEPTRAVKAGDSATIDVVVSIDGTVREDMGSRGRTVEVGKNLLVKEIEEALPGMNVGDTKDVELKFPEEHGREELRGKTAQIKLTVNELREKVLPALDDDFAKDANYESFEAMKKSVRERLEKDAKAESDAKLREDVVLALADKNPLTVPPSLVTNAITMIAREMVQFARLNSESFDAEQIVKDAQEQAEKRVRAGLLLAELANRNNLTVTEADVSARYEQMAKETNKAVARIRAEHRDEKKREAILNSILEDKVLAHVLSKVQISDAKPEEAK